MKKSKVLIVCILITLEIFALYKLNQKKYNKEIKIIEKEYINNTENNNVWEDKISFTIEPTYNPIDKSIVIKKPLILENVEIKQNQLYQGSLISYFKITYYCSCRKCNGSYATGATASGKPMKVGITVACNSIKLGTKIIIDGHQYEVQDTGGMANNVIDIYVNSHSEAMQKGIHYNVPVYYCQ